MMTMSEMVTRDREWLATIADGREVYVYAAELGARYPVLHGLADSLPYFQPWSFRCRIEYIRGAVALRVPIRNLLYGRDAGRVLACLRQAQIPGLQARPCVRRILRMLETPDAAPRLLEQDVPAGNEQAMMEHSLALLDAVVAVSLTRQSPETVPRLLSAARDCVRATHGLTLCLWEHLIDLWLGVVDDADQARQVLCEAFDVYNRTPDLSHPLVLHLTMKYPGLLGLETAYGYVPRPGAGYRPLFYPYLSGICWLRGGQRRNALRCAALVGRQPPGPMRTGILFYRLSGLASWADRARQAMARARRAQHPRAGVQAGEAALLACLYLRDPRHAAALIAEPEAWELNAEDRNMLYKACLQTGADPAIQKQQVTRLTNAESCSVDWVNLASLALDYGRSDAAIRWPLEMAMGVANDPVDLEIIGGAWMELLGDSARASACLDRVRKQYPGVNMELSYSRLFRSDIVRTYT